MSEGATGPRDTIGMTAEEMPPTSRCSWKRRPPKPPRRAGYVRWKKNSNRPGFAAARAAASYYAIKLLDANNSYIARYLLDRGVFTGNDT